MEYGNSSVDSLSIVADFFAAQVKITTTGVPQPIDLVGHNVENELSVQAAAGNAQKVIVGGANVTYVDGSYNGTPLAAGDPPLVLYGTRFPSTLRIYVVGTANDVVSVMST